MMSGCSEVVQRPQLPRRTGTSAGSAHDGTIQPIIRDFEIDPSPSTPWAWSWQARQMWSALQGRWSLCLRDLR